MIECIVAWFCLFIGIISGNPSWYIASGVFAIAVQVDRLIHKMDGDKDGK